jgi:hypothetical protein
VSLKVATREDAMLAAARGSEALAHLLAVLEHAAETLDWIGSDVDAKIVRAHRAQLERGHEWPGDPITPCEEYLP